MTTLSDLATPCLILDRPRLAANLARMSEACRRNGVALRPHLKTAKSVEVARLALAGEVGGVAVSTLREAEYFAAAGLTDIQYAVSIVPDKLDRVAAIEALGARVTLITDALEVAKAVSVVGARLGRRFHVQIEIDCGERRSGLAPDAPEVIAIARALDSGGGTVFAGVMTHAGHSYASRSLADVERVAEAERAAAVAAAEAIRAAGIACPAVSIGSTPTGLHARHLEGVTEVRAGVYMFGDMFQAQIGSCAVADLAVSVLAEVIGHRADLGHILVDAGALALSKDRSTEAVPNDVGFGLVADRDGRPFDPQMKVTRVYQEHGLIPVPAPLSVADFPIGTRLRIYPNHVCMTAAMYSCYHVVEGGPEVVAVWDRANGW